MMTRLGRGLNFHKGFLLFIVARMSLVAAFAQVKLGINSGQPSDDTASQTRPMAFDVVSIRPSRPDEELRVKWNSPDGFSARSQTLLSTIVMAYLPPSQWLTNWGLENILGVPPWVRNDRYDIEARVAPNDMLAWQNQGPEKKMLRLMLQSMLHERCKLVMRPTTVEAPVYALVVGKRGSKLKQAKVNAPLPSNAVPLLGGGGLVPYQKGQAPRVTYLSITMKSFAAELSGFSNRPVVDRTDLPGIYDFELRKKDDPEEPSTDPAPANEWDLAELGFKLVPMKIPVDGLAIDHIERPSEN